MYSSVAVVLLVMSLAAAHIVTPDARRSRWCSAPISAKRSHPAMAGRLAAMLACPAAPSRSATLSCAASRLSCDSPVPSLDRARNRRLIEPVAPARLSTADFHNAVQPRTVPRCSARAARSAARWPAAPGSCLPRAMRSHPTKPRYLGFETALVTPSVAPPPVPKREVLRIGRHGGERCLRHLPRCAAQMTTASCSAEIERMDDHGRQPAPPRSSCFSPKSPPAEPSR